MFAGWLAGSNIRRTSEKMANEVLKYVEVLFLLFMWMPKCVSAFDGGDAAALILGLVMGILGICGCLGYYARKRSGSA